MSMEVELKRIADALETMIGMNQTETTIEITTDAPEEVPTAPAEPEAKKPAKKKKVVAKKKEVDVPETDEAYQARMHEVANRITVHTGDPAKTNELFAKLQGEFKKVYPDNEHVFDVQKDDYAGVCELVEAFLAKEGIK